MKITTRIISGYGLFLAVLAGLVMYQVITIQKMRDISDSLSGIHFQNVRASLRAWEVLRLVEDRTEKAFRLSDPDYLQQVHDHQKEFEANLGELQTKVSSSAERDEVKRLFQLWNTYVSDFRQLEQLLPQKGRVLPQNLQEDLNNLDTQIDSLYQAMLLSMDSISERARKTADTAVTVLWCATLAALAISILVSLLIVRSISKPLAHLTEGTRAIADGKFFYRLDTTRNDEFAQLAKDFNKMTSHLNELDVLKKGFVSHVSHELKAPLVSMRESIQLMLEEIPGPLSETVTRPKYPSFSEPVSIRFQCSGMPGGISCTLSTRTWTSPFLGENFTAFPTMFSTTCTMRSLSHSRISGLSGKSAFTWICLSCA